MGMFWACALVIASPAINEATDRTDFLDDFFCIVKKVLPDASNATCFSAAEI
jgi:hypothetical protein